MKVTIAYLTCVVFFLFPIKVDAQKISEVTWYGLDFTLAKMVGSAGFNDVDKIKDYYFDTWNSTILIEGEKYNVSKFYGKKVKNKISEVEERNKTVDYKDLVTDNSYELSVENAKTAIAAYKGSDEGYGLIYLVESFDKTKEKAFIWVALFNEKTGDVMYIEKFNGEAGGFGFRNYWLAAILEVMKKSGKRFPH